MGKSAACTRAGQLKTSTPLQNPAHTDVMGIDVVFRIFIFVSA